MNKKLFVLFAVVFILGVNLISAGNYWSYHDVYNDYRYQGNYYSGYNEKYEYTKTIKTKADYDWDSYKTKTTITEKVEVKRTPAYSYYYSTPYRNYYNPPTDYTKHIDYSSWGYKEVYDNDYYDDSNYQNYYYQPRYNYNLGYYNWRF